MDALYDEFSSSKAALEHVVQTGESVVDKWMKFFDFQSQGRDVPLSFSLSYSLGYSRQQCLSRESVFVNECKTECGKEPYDCSLVKAELQVFVNYNVDCRAFHESVLSDCK